MEQLVTLLGRERLLAELVVFKLVELRQLLIAGEARFLPWAAEEVERATASLRQAELQRALLVAQLAAERGLEDPEPPLRQLVAGTPEPWRTLLEESAVALRDLCREAEEHAEANRNLASRGITAVSELLGRTQARDDDGLVLYGPDAVVRTSAPPVRVAQRL